MNPNSSTTETGITIFTIGFAKKSAREFFTVLQRARVRKVVDIRLNNTSQFAGFTKKEDLAYFLEVHGGIGYEHRPELAPTKEILDSYKKKTLTWLQYEEQFLALLAERKVEMLVAPADLDRACLLCVEPSAQKCHRRLVAEYLRSKWGNVEILHLPEEVSHEAKINHSSELQKDGEPLHCGN